MHDVLPVLLYCAATVAAVTTFALVANPRHFRLGREHRTHVNVASGPDRPVRDTKAR
jgi:hypothetical protein